MLPETTISLLSQGLWETVFMTFTAGFFGFLIGLPTGIVLFLTRKGQLLEHVLVHQA